MKTNKSYSKRLRITRQGKILARKSGKNHFNAKAPRHKQLAGKRLKSFTMSNKNLSAYLQI